ncbi:MAG: Ku protein [Acidimicrobiia bacterium]
MPRAIWSGSVSFGLVNVPVKLHTAVSAKDVRFHQIEEGTGARVRTRRVSSVTGEEVSFDQIVKGYEIGPDRYVVITPEELDSLDPKATSTIDIEEFVNLADIDPVYFERPYYLVPDRGGAKAYSLLVKAMSEAGKVAIARMVLRTKQYLATIRPLGNVLCLETMLYPDEVVPAEDLPGIPDDDVSVTDRELAMARQLIESLSGEFEPRRYRDEYRERVLELIDRKAEGQEIVVQAQVEEPAKVVDLLAALEASLEDAKAARRRSSERESA